MVVLHLRFSYQPTCHLWWKKAMVQPQAHGASQKWHESIWYTCLKMDGIRHLTFSKGVLPQDSKGTPETSSNPIIFERISRFFGGEVPSLKLRFSNLKMDGIWNANYFPYWVLAYFQGRTVSFRERNSWKKQEIITLVRRKVTPLKTDMTYCWWLKSG